MANDTTTELTEEQKEELLKQKKKAIIAAACPIAIKSIVEEVVYPDDDDFCKYTDSSCQMSLLNKIRFYAEKDVIYNSTELTELLQKAIVDKEYEPDGMYIEADSQTAKDILGVIELELDGDASGEALAELLSVYLHLENDDESEQVYTEYNLYAKQLANLPLDPETGAYTIPKVTVGHIVFLPDKGFEDINFRTVYHWNESGIVTIDYSTGIVTRKSDNKKLGTVVEYKAGYNGNETIEDALYQEDRESDMWQKSMLINGKTGESEEYDYKGRRINADEPAKIRIFGVENLLADEETYETEMTNKAICGYGGSTYALDKEIAEAATGYRQMLSDWMTQTEFDDNPQMSLARGF